ncbi:alcohol dehydrogenase [Prunus yedoensis var. nudiflora]|uniref:Alcohol dehydrogenase n=1 Tax=Prunus yedoensis var. nudiflora TaxID=2094558 RepID=A0A314XUE8_PRUYE|nr:alcohol dehydrogenase [Prunus yedoensis var. nudiflora]
MCDLLRINTNRGVMIGDGKQRFSKNGTPINQFLGTSTFSEYTVIHEGCLAKIDPSAPVDKVCILSCGVSSGARISGASRIFGVDLNPKRLEEAKNFGVNEFVNPRDHIKPVQEIIAEMTNGGVDRSLECTGNINLIISAFECVYDGWGVAVLVGVPSTDAIFKTNPFNFLDERTLKGTFFRNYKPRTDLPSVVDMYMNKVFKSSVGDFNECLLITFQQKLEVEKLLIDFNE